MSSWRWKEASRGTHRDADELAEQLDVGGAIELHLIEG
jgi:hypothetical protein